MCLRLSVPCASLVSAGLSLSCVSPRTLSPLFFPEDEDEGPDQGTPLLLPDWEEDGLLDSEFESSLFCEGDLVFEAK